MGISDRIEGSIENWRKTWGEALKAFLVRILSFGLEVFMDILAKAFAPKLEPLIDKLNATGKVPPELQPLLDEILNPTGEIGAMLGQSAGSALVGGAIGKIIDGILLPLAYGINSVTRNVELADAQMLALWLRGKLNDTQLDQRLSWLGVAPEVVPELKELTQIRLTPDMVMRLWLRNKVLYETLWNDLKDTGVSPGRIEHLKELAHAMPSPQDVVNFMAHEVFEDTMIAKYGLNDEWEDVRLDWFEKAGVKPDVANLYWKDHWKHPAFREVTDMLHRGELEPNDVYDWYRLVEIPPYWRDKLTKISWDVPNRIELRMMARYGLVGKDFLLTMLEKVGLAEEYRDVAADMMLAMGIRTDLSTRFSKGWLDAGGVESELAISGLSPEVADRMYEWIVKNVEPERTEKERDLTKTDIYRGVKKGVITRTEGTSLLTDMGYDSTEAKFILDLNAPVDQEEQEVKQRELTKTDITKAYKLGTIDYPETISMLMGIRYTMADAHFIAGLVDATKEPIEDIRQRELTKIDIVKGVKAGVITSYEGYIMLQDIGYSPADSQFILEVRVEAVAGSPDTYGEFRQMVQTYRATQGLPSKDIPLELIQAEKDVKAAEAALASGKDRKVKPKRLAELEGAVETAKIAYHQLLQEDNKEEQG